MLIPEAGRQKIAQNRPENAELAFSLAIPNSSKPGSVSLIKKPAIIAGF
jgi:hypothetical protein